MDQRTVGIDLAIRGDHVARILDDGRPHGKPMRFRLMPDSLGAMVARLRGGMPPGAGGGITAVWSRLACPGSRSPAGSRGPGSR